MSSRVKMSLVALVVFFFILGLSVSELYTKVPLSANTLATSTQLIVPSEQTLLGLPIHLTIPRIHVDASLEYVGLTATGAVDVPTVPANPAWYSLGPRPGQTGSAVIVGHFGWKKGMPAVFDDLSTLRKGDKLYVKNEHGATTTFIVRELRSYSAHDSAVEVFSSSDGKAHLNLITCEGTWNKIEESYSKRLVVFADLEDR